MAELGVIAGLTTMDLRQRFEKRQMVARKLHAIIRRYVRRRQRKISLFILFIGKCLRDRARQRRFWIEPSRGKSLFWEEAKGQWKDDTLWLENFRISRQSFLFICHGLQDTLKRKDTRFRKAITVEKRIAICLWHLATGEDLRSLGWRFDVEKSTVCQVVNEVCQAIVDVLLPGIIKWPTGDDLKTVIEGFKTTWRFPQCAGAIDGTHIPIVAPKECPADYYNRKGFYSLVMQVVVDHTYRFTDVYIKWPGRVHDARVFSNSGLYLKGQQGDLFPDWTEGVHGFDVPLVIIGDAAYPLLPWLMKGFQDSGEFTMEQQQFNSVLSSARMVVE